MAINFPDSPTNGQTHLEWTYNSTTGAWSQSNTGTAGADGADGADGSSVTAYANATAFPSSGNTVGDFAFANDTKALYVWDGSEWDRIYSDSQEGPTFTTSPNSSCLLYTSPSPRDSDSSRMPSSA